MKIPPVPKELVHWFKIILAFLAIILFIINAIQTHSTEGAGWAALALLWILESIEPENLDKKDEDKKNDRI